MQQKNEEMNFAGIYELIINHTKKHGLSFLLLMGMVFWFNQQYINLSEKIDACNQSTIEIYKSQNERLINVLERNSEAMENISRHLEK
jgi:hypothetical protein